MSTIVYINDNNLLLQQGTNITHAQGYALFKDGEVEFDNAVKQCRLDPQQINNRYWQQCDQSAISQNEAGMRHAGDLVWKQLSALQQQFNLTELGLVVPSHYQTNNLQLLLGIAKSVGLEITSLVNKSVLMLSSEVSSDGDYLHIDLQLNQTVCSSVRSSDGQLSLTGVDIVHEVSIQSIQDALLKVMQHRFIHADRFDPLHHAETEQQLFDQIPAAAMAIATEGKANLSVEYQGKHHTVSIDEKQWQAALQPFVEKLFNIGSTSALQHCYLQANNLFSGADVWQLEASRFSLLAESQLPPTTHIPLNQNTTAELTYTTLLPLLRSQKPNDIDLMATARPAKIAASNSDASHLLCGGLAISIQKVHISTDNNQLSISTGGQANALEMLQSGQLFVINDPDRTAVEKNDRLGSNLADGLITVIQVKE